MMMKKEEYQLLELKKYLKSEWCECKIMKKNLLVGIIDTKTSNIKSVYYALNQQNVEIDYYIILRRYNKPVDAMIVPGIGNFSFVMENLKKKI